MSDTISSSSLLIENDEEYDGPSALLTPTSLSFSDVVVIKSEKRMEFNIGKNNEMSIDEKGLYTSTVPLTSEHITNKAYVDSLKPILNCNGFQNAGPTTLSINVAVFPTSSVLRVDITSITQQVLLIGSMMMTSVGSTANVGMTIGYGLTQTQSTSYINLANNLPFSTTEIAVSNASGEQNNLNTLLCCEFIKDASQGQSLNCSVRFCPTAIGTYYFTMRFVSGTAGSTYFRNCNIISLII